MAELIEPLLTTPVIRIERITSRGDASPPGYWYDQAEHEWVTVVSGRARLEFDGGPTVEMGPGDHVNITAHARHRVAWTDPDQPTVWLAVFYTA